MKVIGYQDVVPLQAGRSNVLFRAVHTETGVPVILKTSRTERPTPREIARLRCEYEITAQVASPFVVRARGFEMQMGRPWLVLENFPGESLDRWLGTPLETGTFLRIAVSLADALADLHATGIVHRDVKPANILVCMDTGELKLTDLGIATLDAHGPEPARNPEQLEGSLAYLSPEQTGRMNRGVDFRADFYSLGVTFYEMLTGRVPFEALDTLAWVHAHIAEIPVPPRERVPSVPEPLSDIVLRLLAKAAEDRYPSAAALAADLRKCQDAWKSTGRLERFTLTASNHSPHLHAPQELYGREAELATLTELFACMHQTGAPALALVGGYSGIGKSALVQRLRTPVNAAGGLFASGKFDQYQANKPYLTIAQAFHQLVQRVLAEDERRLAPWREALREALGVNGRLITEVIPLVELIIGPSPPVQELPLGEAQNRFHRVFRQFMDVFARPDHPLVLFLDDLQWADAATLRLLEELAAHPDTRHVLFVGAYRDNEVQPGHPLRECVERIRAAGVTTRELTLSPLGEPDVHRFVAAALRTDTEFAAPLARLVYTKTGGNPFFITQFLMNLLQEGLLAFDSGVGRWHWDLELIRDKGYTENILDLMRLRIERLPADTQELLRLAACLGGRIDLATLAIAGEQSSELIAATLGPAVHENLLIQSEHDVRFLHDRVQQSAYQTIPETERGDRQLRIARRLWRAFQATPLLGERVFDVVNLFNAGVAQLTDPDERARVAELNLAAGRKAKAAAAYTAARTYFAAGLTLLPIDAWSTLYPLDYALHLELAQTEWILGDFAAAERLLSTAIPRARTKIEQAALFRAYANVHTTKGDLIRSAEISIEALARFDLHLPLHPSMNEVNEFYARLRACTSACTSADLLSRPLMTDPDKQAVMGLLSNLVVSAYLANGNLFLLIIGHIVDLSLRYGHTDVSAMGYVCFGMALGSIYGAYAEGYRYGELARDLVDRHDFIAQKAPVYNAFGEKVGCWRQSYGFGLDYMRASFTAANEAGDVVWAGFACNNITTLRMMRGDPLEVVYQESERRLEFVRRARFDDIARIIVGIQRLIRNLQGRTLHFSTFSDESFREEDFESEILQSRMMTMVCWYRILQLQARYLSGDWERAHEAGRLARELLWSSLAASQVAEFHFYNALTLAALQGRRAPAARDELAREFAEHEEQYRIWAENCPANFEAKYFLLRAERHRLEGATIEALRDFEEAIRSARRDGLTPIEALAYERAAEFQAERGYTALARHYRGEACQSYARWGADGKVRQLQSLHPELLESSAPLLSATITTPAHHLDLMSVLKASQLISGEIVFNKLLQTLTGILVEAAGAQRGCLALPGDPQVVIAAELPARTEEIARPLSERLPRAVLNYVGRTREPVLLGDAIRDAHPFANDPYFATRQPRSVLCLPLEWQGLLKGFIYLENSSAPGVFTRERLTVLQLLGAQAAISLENARLYDEARERIRMREEFIAVASHELRTPLVPLMLQLEMLTNLADARMTTLLQSTRRRLHEFANLVESLLDVSRMESGNSPELARQNFSLAELVQQVVDQHAPTFVQARCELHLQCEPGLEAWADRERIAQVVSNLLVNASKYGAGQPIWVTTRREGNHAVIHVRDRGIGVSPENQERIFHRFERAVPTRNFGGFGLGLYIAREIVRAHGGILRVESQLGEGSTFTVELPLSPAAL